MSLINKMLQDLDARGSQAGSALQSDIKPVAMAERKLPFPQIAMAAGVAVIALAALGVWWFKRPAAAPAAVVVLAPPAAAPAAVAPPVPAAGTRRVPLSQTAAAEAPAPVAVAAAPVTPAVSEHIIAPASSVPVPVKPPKAPRDAGVVKPVKPASAPAMVAGGRDMNDTQRAEAQYRHALAALDDGRVPSAMALLEQTLILNPRHDAARQSLVALLIEAGRPDEAMQQLEQGLAIDPAQPALAMLLARMQIERGNSGVATLLRSLPAAAGDGDYHAFLAGALQREQRHKEALVHYAAALRTAPEQGIWLMGMGISLQADQRNAEALDVFKRARASGMLTAPLATFVDRKIAQLTP
jgi:MSHA biogenesis protein MshN